MFYSEGTPTGRTQCFLHYQNEVFIDYCDVPKHMYIFPLKRAIHFFFFLMLKRGHAMIQRRLTSK